MDRSKTPISRSQKKGAALLVAAFTLCNFIFIFPAYASSVPQQALASSPANPSSAFCIPIPIIHPCNTPTSTPAPPPPTPTPSQCIPVPIIHPCKSPTPTATNTPTSGGTGTPTPTGTPGKPPQLSMNGSFTLTATEIVGTDAHLDASDVQHPILTFSSVTIEGLKLTHLAITLSATGLVSGSGVAIKTSVFKDLMTALHSFTNKADLVLLLAGVTVKRLTMRDVTLQVDRYVLMQTLTISGLIVG